MIDQNIKEIAASQPKLRRDVRITCREEGAAENEPVFVVEDPLAGKFFEIGEKEQGFLRLLNGQRTINEAVALASKGGSGLTEQNAVSLVKMLSSTGLLETDADHQHSQRVRNEGSDKRDADKATQKAKGMFFLKIPLFNPDRFLGRINDLTRVIPGGVFVFIWLVVIVWALGTYFNHADRFSDEMKGLLQVGNLAIFGVVWLALKAAHEFCHGIVCKRFGGPVPETGVSMLLFITPLAYVDASSSIKFNSKWHRIFVAAAGMFGEFFIASIALIIWANIEPGVFGSVLHQVVMISTITTVIFNANPLMRFDGYYILSDLLGISNLFTKGKNVFVYLVKRWILGIKGASFPLRETSKRRIAIISIYGVLAAFWKVIVCVGLFIAATMLFEGAGKLIAILVALAMLFGMLRSAVGYFKKQAASERTSFLKVAFRIVLLIAIPVGLAFVVKITPGVTAAGIVDSGKEGEIRVQCPGFVFEVAVANGDVVRQGDLLIRLENPQAELELANLERELRRARVRADMYFAEEEVAGFQAEQENIEGLEGKVADMRTHIETLELRAPRAGLIFGEDIDSMDGAFMSEGSIAFRIVDPVGQKIRIAIPQTDYESIPEITAGDHVGIFSTGSGEHQEAQLERVRPQAVTEVPHPGLTSMAGGPLIVMRGAEEPQLVKPHFIVDARIENRVSNFAEGQVVWARFNAGERKTVAEWVWDRVGW